MNASRFFKSPLSSTEVSKVANPNQARDVASHIRRRVNTSNSMLKCEIVKFMVPLLKTSPERHGQLCYFPKPWAGDAAGFAVLHADAFCPKRFLNHRENTLRPEKPSWFAISFSGRRSPSTKLAHISVRTASSIDEYDCPSRAKRRFRVRRLTPKSFATCSAEQLSDLSVAHTSSRTVSLASKRPDGKIESKYSFK